LRAQARSIIKSGILPPGSIAASMELILSSAVGMTDTYLVL